MNYVDDHQMTSDRFHSQLICEKEKRLSVIDIQLKTLQMDSLTAAMREEWKPSKGIQKVARVPSSRLLIDLSRFWTTHRDTFKQKVNSQPKAKSIKFPAFNFSLVARIKSLNCFVSVSRAFIRVFLLWSYKVRYQDNGMISGVEELLLDCKGSNFGSISML